MKTESAILILVCTLLLSACGELPRENTECFELSEYGEAFASDNAVFCVGKDEISAYGLDGEKLSSLEKSSAEMQYSTAGSYAIISDENGIYISDGENTRHNCEKNKIMSTAINKNGYAVVCTEEAGYKGSITVFDENFVPLYKWYSASGFIIKAALSENNILAVLTANEEGSRVHIFELDSENEKYTVSILDELAIDFAWLADKLCVISEKAAYFAEKDVIKKSVDFDGNLGEYAFGDERLFIELLRGDGMSEIFSYDENGREKGNVQCEFLRGITADSIGAAVISGNDAVLYDENLKELSRSDARGARNVMLVGGEMYLLRDKTVFK